MNVTNVPDNPGLPVTTLRHFCAAAAAYRPSATFALR
jgi:hypothetical protein